MKIAIVGAGAIGGFVGAKLALAGEDVTFMVRGANLEAIRANGIRLVAHDGAEATARNVAASNDYAATGPQDLVILATKAHQLEAVAASAPRLFGPDTAVVTMQNGIPYWYFHRHGGSLAGSRVASVDPTGAIGEAIPAGRVIGCVVYPAAELVAPGVVRHIEGDRFPMGELDGTTTPRVERVCGAFTRAGLKAPVLDDIRSEIWLKLWGNLTFNPISALTHATLDVVATDTGTRMVARRMMEEAETIARRIGAHFRVDIERRINGAASVGAHRTSMLQDLEKKRPIELDALLSVVQEMGRLVDVNTPTIDVVLALTKQMGRVAGVYPTFPEAVLEDEQATAVD